MPVFLPFLPLLLAAGEPVDFARDVRPILSNHCFKCHGPGTQKAKLRLDAQHFATRNSVVVPGNVEKSHLIERVLSKDATECMPPADSGEPLSAKQIEILKRWIQQGANYTPHWAFQAPKRPALPQPQKNAIDAFVNQRLQRAGIEPSPRAEKATLIRRVTLDLIGFLPTPQEVDDFVHDASPDAYENLVDRLLASPHYGERQARHWLDLARYADSNGYTIDGPRSIWLWRDWVISAFNADLPYDQFTKDQLAGDMLPKPSKDQIVATGFHRNTAYNEEGGTDPEQFRVERTVDRTNTTAAVWLGLTLGCAQCHDHKYDPVSQVDYYRFYAFFNSCDEPVLPVGGKPEIEQKLNELDAIREKFRRVENKVELAKVEAQMKKLRGDLPQTMILKERKEPRPSHVQIRGDFLRLGDPVVPGIPPALGSNPGSKLNRLDLATWLGSKANPLTARVEVNRLWQQFFGRGLVETENDFGIQGSLPTHPELLDWLACEFMEPTDTRRKPWSIKAIIRQIVTSETYCRSSVTRQELREVDPRNLLLASQNRLRLDAEVIRDTALSASGKLSKKIGGPPVFPPQPEGVFSFTQSSGRAWKVSEGEDRYRRGLYTHIWRQSQHPLMTTFDGADAQTPCTRRNRTNTPLQALHMANDPVFVELAEALGKRVQNEALRDNLRPIDQAFLICLARKPRESELARLQDYMRQIPDPEKASTALARVLFNLDEFITRE